MIKNQDILKINNSKSKFLNCLLKRPMRLTKNHQNLKAQKYKLKLETKK